MGEVKPVRAMAINRTKNFPDSIFILFKIKRIHCDAGLANDAECFAIVQPDGSHPLRRIFALDFYLKAAGMMFQPSKVTSTAGDASGRISMRKFRDSPGRSEI